MCRTRNFEFLPKNVREVIIQEQENRRNDKVASCELWQLPFLQDGSNVSIQDNMIIVNHDTTRDIIKKTGARSFSVSRQDKRTNKFNKQVYNNTDSYEIASLVLV